MLTDDDIEQKFDEIFTGDSRRGDLGRFAVFVRRLETREAERGKGEPHEDQPIEVPITGHIKLTFGKPIAAEFHADRDPSPYADKVMEVARDVLRSGLLVKLNEKTTLAGIMELAKECAVILITAANEASMKREGGNRD